MKMGAISHARRTKLERAAVVCQRQALTSSWPVSGGPRWRRETCKRPGERCHRMTHPAAGHRGDSSSFVRLRADKLARLVACPSRTWAGPTGAAPGRGRPHRLLPVVLCNRPLSKPCVEDLWQARRRPTQVGGTGRGLSDIWRVQKQCRCPLLKALRCAPVRLLTAVCRHGCSFAPVARARLVQYESLELYDVCVCLCVRACACARV